MIKRSLNNESIPVFCEEILLSFLELKSLYIQFGQDLVFFHNKEILIDGKTFFFKKLVSEKRNMHSRSLKQ